MMYLGMNITTSPHATERVLRWPDKKRSKRLVKKMTARLGPQIHYRPAAIVTPWGMVVHPEIFAKLKNSFDSNQANVAPKPFGVTL